MKNKFHIVLYFKKNCQKCKFTERRFKSKNIPMKTILVDPESDKGKRKLDKFREEGAQAFPVIRVYEGLEDDGSKAVDKWNDVNIPKINSWINQAI